MSAPISNIIRLSLIVILFQFSNIANAQLPVFKKEKRLTKQAESHFAQKDFAKAAIKFREISTRYKGNTDIWYKLAVSYQELGQPERAELYYNKIVKEGDEVNPLLHLSLGQVYMMQGKYPKAREHFQKYNDILEYNDQMAMRYISSIENIDKYFTDSSFFKSENLPMNSGASDFSATIIDEDFYFLSTRSKKGDYTDRYASDLFMASGNENAVFESPKKIGGPANSRFGEIGYAIVPKTKEIFICRYEPGKQNEYSMGYNLYKAYINSNKEISKPEKFEMENFKYAIAYPTLNADGSKMVFASDAPGGYGGWDLYEADYTSEGLQNILNLGGKVNSAGDELYPFLLNDTIIFYATDGHGGLGGFDIYSKNLANTNEHARNLGFPVNSESNDYGIYFDTGLTGYFSSNRIGGKGKDDIYKFMIHQIKIQGEVVDLDNGDNLKNVSVSVNRSKGGDEVLALADNGRLQLAAQPGEEIEITIEKEGYEKRTFAVNTSSMTFTGNHNLEIGKLKVEKLETNIEPISISAELLEKEIDENIFFSVQIAAGRVKINKSTLKNKYSGNLEIKELFDGRYYRYYLEKHPSYFEAKEVWKKMGKKKSFLVAYNKNQSVRVMKALKDVHVVPAEAKDPEVHEFISTTDQVTSSIIYYGLDKFRIPREAEPKLNRIIKQLKDNPNYFLEIAAHTDKRGSDMYNRALSEERARFLKEYIVSNGIGANRVISHGIGEKQLKNYCANCSEADHKQNRRAELILRTKK